MHGRRRPAGDERARQVEQQRGILVGAGVEALQRDQQIAAVKIRIADQVERRVGGDETRSWRTSRADGARRRG